MLPAGTAVARGSGADLVISSGPEGGGYHEIGRRVRNLLTNEHHYYVEVEPSRGSMENLARLADPESPVGAALAQTDALNLYLREHPEFAQEFVVLADIGKECVFLIAGRAGDLLTAADLKADAGRSIAVGHEDSGAAVTWAHMGQLEPRLQNTRPVYVDVVEALARIKARENYSKLETAMLVQRPHVASPPLEIVLDSPDAFRILAIRAGDLKSPALPNGAPVYTFEKVEVRKVSFDTICTRGLLLASKQKVDASVRSRLAEVLLESASYIAPKGE
jgi:hypothetical protein